MCNCGSSGRPRSQAVDRGTAGPAVARDFGIGAPIAQNTFVEFVYVGATALTAVGPITQTRYRFTKPGARLRVDARDAASLAQIAKLRRG